MRAAPRLRALDLDAQRVACDQPAVAVGIREVVVLGVLAGGHRLGGEERRAELAELVDAGPLGLEHQVAGEHLLGDEPLEVQLQLALRARVACGAQRQNTQKDCWWSGRAAERPVGATLLPGGLPAC